MPGFPICIFLYRMRTMELLILIYIKNKNKNATRMVLIYLLSNTPWKNWKLFDANVSEALHQAGTLPNLHWHVRCNLRIGLGFILNSIISSSWVLLSAQIGNSSPGSHRPTVFHITIYLRSFSWKSGGLLVDCRYGQASAIPLGVWACSQMLTTGACNISLLLLLLFLLNKSTLWRLQAWTDAWFEELKSMLAE